jgi:hypothetical protein
VHLVKGAASNVRQNPANQGTASPAGASGTPAPQVPTNLATGVGNNPLAGLTGARYAGFHGLPGADMFGPDGGVSASDSEAASRVYTNSAPDGPTARLVTAARDDGESHVLVANERGHEQPCSH